MIWAFTGKTGSGKTFRMVKEAYRYWRDGIDIYSNTVLLFEKQKPSFWEKTLQFATIKKIKRGRIRYFEDISEILDIKNGLILFDEAQVLFNARQWESLPAEFQYKLQQHRKHRIDLFCTTQNLGTVDISYRRLIQAWFHCETIFDIGKSPRVWFGAYRMNQKDIDQIYNTVDDLKVDTIISNLFCIHRFSQRLYDTMYDIGFKRFKIVWLSSYQTENNQLKKEQTYLIIPKKMSLSDALKDIRLSASLLNPSKSAYSRRS